MVSASDQDKADQSKNPAFAPPRSGSVFEQFKHLLPDGPPASITEDHVRSVLIVRRGREAIFGQNLFSDPAWDVMLELYAARFAGGGRTASELARAIGGSRSVITRWIAALADAGLVETRGNGIEAEPTVVFTDDAAAKMARLVSQWSSAFFAI
jgi:DNA-binding transcriptional ArsR family regulator